MINQNSNELYDFVGKLVVIGESSVGKSNILSRYCKNEFNKEIKMTIGVEFFTKIVSIQGKSIKFQIWDTAGQERYKSITNSFFTSTTAAIVVFDLTNNQSFEKVDFWINEVKQHTKDDLIIMLIGNKSDLENRSVSPTDIQKKAELYKIEFIETSALLNVNINEAFDRIITKIYDKLPQLNSEMEKEYIMKESIVLCKSNKLDKNQEENKKECCK
jgi:Ras-related protein Rab-11A